MFANEIAKSYDAWYETPLGSFVDKVETSAAMDLFKVSTGMSILDAGCGTGNFSIKLSQLGCQVTGIDISSDMLHIARENASVQAMDIDFKQMDLYHLDFPDNSFDGVFSMAAFEFIKDADKAFKELFRVLKPGGKLLIGTIHKDSVWGKMYEDYALRDETSVFRNADLKTLTQLKLLDEKNLLATRGCVYIPPTTEENRLTLEHENTLFQTESPGFILGLWKKARE